MENKATGNRTYMKFKCIKNTGWIKLSKAFHTTVNIQYIANLSASNKKTYHQKLDKNNYVNCSRNSFAAL